MGLPLWAGSCQARSGYAERKYHPLPVSRSGKGVAMESIASLDWRNHDDWSTSEPTRTAAQLAKLKEVSMGFKQPGPFDYVKLALKMFYWRFIWRVPKRKKGNGISSDMGD